MPARYDDPRAPRPPTSWEASRDEWVSRITSFDAAKIQTQILTKHAPLDENDGDRAETAGALLWLATRGAQGEEWGIAGVAAQEIGLWP